MKIHVKVLKGEVCTVEVTEKTTILELKAEISKIASVPVAQQRLVYIGKTLSDDKTIDFYSNIKDGTRINMIVKEPENLSEVMMKFLVKFYNREQAIKITEQFMKDFEAKANSLSWDDLERIATAYYAEGNS